MLGTHFIKMITAYRCHVFFKISNVCIQVVLRAIVTFVPRQHILKLNKHGNVNKSPPINIYFLIAGLENISLENWNVRELTSQMGSKLMS